LTAAAAGLGLALLARTSSARPSGPDTREAAIQDVELSQDAHAWLLAKSWIESRGNDQAVNLGDGAAAMQAAERLQGDGRLPRCRPLEEYAFSGGAWGLIPAIFLVVAYPNNPEMLCADPRIVLSPRESLAMVLAYAGRLQKKPEYRANPTWETLWLGFQRPAFMGDRTSERAQKSLENMREGLARYGASQIAQKKPPIFLEDGEFYRAQLFPERKAA